MSYELLPHTADLRAVLRGADLAQLYSAAVDFVRGTLVGTSDIRATTSRTIEVPGGLDDAERLFRFVRELLYLFDVEGFVAACLDDVASLTVRGEVLDLARHTVEHQVKAVTRHRYSFQRTAAGYEAYLILDL